MKSKQLDAIADATVKTIKRALASRDERIAGLEAKVGALEKTIGTLSQKTFAPNAIVYDGEGTAWRATRTTRSQPGTSGDWELVERLQ